MNEVLRLVQQVKEHPKCARFEQSSRLYRAITPAGGVAQARVGTSKAEALRRLLGALDE